MQSANATNGTFTPETSELLALAKKYVLHTAVRPDVIMAAGDGMYVTDTEGNRYLDFVGGWAVNALGHSPAALQQALAVQAATLVNGSPGFYNKPMAQFAEQLCLVSGMDKVFFASSGAEANESAVKLARKYGATRRGGAYEIIAFDGGFHGRTLAMMSATGKPQWKSLFAPKVDGFLHVPFNDLDACRAAVTSRTCAIMTELVQGENGVRPIDGAVLKGLRQLCDEAGILLIVDEIQTGMGRTGRLFACEHYGVLPDIMTLGKGIGAGFPLSAMLTWERYDLFAPGEQGGTYSSQPLAMAAGLAVLKQLVEQDLTGNARRQGDYLLERLSALEHEGLLRNPRGKGLLLAFDIAPGAAAELVAACAAAGLLVNAPNGDSVRLMPALIAERRHIDDMLAILRQSLIAIARSAV